MSSASYILFKNGKLGGLFNEISLGPENGIVLRYPFGGSFGAPVGSYEGFKYGKLDGTLIKKSPELEGRFYSDVQSWCGYQIF